MTLKIKPKVSDLENTITDDQHGTKTTIPSAHHTKSSIINIKTIAVLINTSSTAYVEIADLRTSFTLADITDVVIALNFAWSPYWAYCPHILVGYLKIELDDVQLGNEHQMAAQHTSNPYGQTNFSTIVRAKEDVAVGDHTLKVYWKVSNAVGKQYSAVRDQIIFGV